MSLCGWQSKDRLVQSAPGASWVCGVGLLVGDARSVIGPLGACDVFFYFAADELCEEPLIQVQGPLREQGYRAVVAASGYLSAVPAEREAGDARASLREGAETLAAREVPGVRVP
jgi:hypothetical protein